jgi:hypothetical protein
MYLIIYIMPKFAVYYKKKKTFISF